MVLVPAGLPYAGEAGSGDPSSGDEPPITRILVGNVPRAPPAATIAILRAGRDFPAFAPAMRRLVDKHRDSALQSLAAEEVENAVPLIRFTNCAVLDGIHRSAAGLRRAGRDERIVEVSPKRSSQAPRSTTCAGAR
jgi:hypothetical protein